MLRSLSTGIVGSQCRLGRGLLAGGRQYRCNSTESSNDSDNAASWQELMARLQSRDSTTAMDHIEMTPEVEQQLDQEFQKLMKDFALEPDLTHEVIKLVERTAVQGPRMGAGVAGKNLKKQSDGNIKGLNNFPNVRRTDRSEAYSPQELYMRRLFHGANTNKLGSTVSDVYRPHKDNLSPPSVKQTSLSTLLAAGCHLGHSTALFRPSTQPYIYGIRDGIHIIDLDQTLVHLRRASKVVEGIAEKGGLILFVGTRNGQQRSLQLAAKRAGGYYVHSRWVPGTLTNATEISGSWDRIEVNMGDEISGREISPNLRRTIVKPDLVVLLNPVENRNAIHECIAAKIPTIGIIDTDSEPSLVSYPIPANDDSLRSTDLLLGVLSKAAEKGKSTRVTKFKQYQQQVAAQSAKEATADFNMH